MSEALTDIEKINLWERAQKDPVFSIREIQGVSTLEPFQERIAHLVWENERVAIKSCHDMGKTFTMAKIVLAFVPVFPRCKVVTTAPTARQVELLLWAEIRAGHAASRYRLGGTLLTKKWEIAPDWWAVGFTTQKNASTGEGQVNSGFQGIHGEHVLVIFDEATGIPPDVWKQLEGILTSANVRFVAVGNPTTKNCEFYKCFSDRSYKKVHLSCFESPNLIANGITDMASLEEEYDLLRELDDEAALKRLAEYKVLNPHLLTARWVMSLALRVGLTHPLFVSKALGEFPNEDERCLMPLGTVEAAQRREPPRKSKKDRFSLGVDVARFGGDLSVLTMIHGVKVLPAKALVKRAVPEVGGAAIAIVNDIPDNERYVNITVDATGIGSGVVDLLNEYKAQHELLWRHVRIIEVHFGETFKEGRDGSAEEVKDKSEQFANKKAQMFVGLAETLSSELVLPEESNYYLEELPSIVYKFDSKGRWVIEDKEAYKKRTRRRSPDYADSLALAHFGRYHTGGVGTFTAEMAKPTGRTLAGPLRKDED